VYHRVVPAKIIDGKKLSEEIQAEITREVALLKKEKGIVPGLAVVLVGDHEASRIYVRNKEAACKKAGMFAEQHTLPASIAEEELLHLITTLNHDPKIHAILVQLPLPKGIDQKRVLESILPEKDVDGFHPTNMGNLLSGHTTIAPCTPMGILKILESIDCRIEGKEAVVVGRSNIVGKPAALLLLQHHATVTLCHTRTRNLADHVGRADILVVAAGQPEVIKGGWIKPGAVVIDVGMNRLAGARPVTGKLVGDVEFEAARSRAGWITPVPGGVGPMTVTMLLWNTLQAAKK